jgi:hypothetical protein
MPRCMTSRPGGPERLTSWDARRCGDGLGAPADSPEVVAALLEKYTGDGDRQYLPDADPDFDVVYAKKPRSAMMLAPSRL